MARQIYEPCMCGDTDCPICGELQGTLTPEILEHGAAVVRSQRYIPVKTTVPCTGDDDCVVCRAFPPECLCHETVHGKTECPVHGDIRDWAYYLEAVEVLMESFGYTRGEADTILESVGVLHRE